MGAEPHLPLHLPVAVGGQPPRPSPTNAGTRVRIERRVIDGEGIQWCACAQCGRTQGLRRTRIRFTQLPPMLMAFLPLSVAVPLLFPVLTGLIVSSRRKADVDMPLCGPCAQAHRQGKTLRDVSATIAAGFALCAPPLALFLGQHHLAVACVWSLLMALSLLGTVAARRAFAGRVMLAESIDDDALVFVGSDAWRGLLGQTEQAGVALEASRP